MKHKGPEQQGTQRGGRETTGRAETGVAARADRELVGRRYETGAAMRSPRTGDPGQEPGAEPVRSSLETAASELHQRHGERISAGAAQVGVPEEAAAAVVLAETANLSGASDARLAIRFEPYAFYQRTGNWLVATHKDQAAEYRVFEQARSAAPEAALESLRMGVAQLSGAEAVAAGFESAGQMFDTMGNSESAQIEGMFNLIANDQELRGAMEQADWQRVAELRAGPGYGALGYDDALAANADAYARALGRPAHGDDDDEDKPKRKRTRPRR